ELRSKLHLFVRRDDLQEALANRIFARVLEADRELGVEGGLRRIADVKECESGVEAPRELNRVSDRRCRRFAEIVRNENVFQSNHDFLRASHGQRAFRWRQARGFGQQTWSDT